MLNNFTKIYLIRANKTPFGGAENYLRRFSKALSSEGIEHQIIHSSFSKIIPSWLRVILFNIKISVFKKNKFYFSLDRITCPDIYRAGDGVHKVFLTYVRKSIFNPLHPLILYVEKKCFNKSKKIITNSQMVKNEIINEFNIHESKIKVIYNGVQIKNLSFAQSFKRLSNEFKFNSTDTIFLYAGNGFKRKGVEEFLKIISKIKESKLKAFVVGGDKKIMFYKKLAKKLNIENKVFFTGERHDIDDFYNVSDVFILPTYYDPFSNVILEAMAFKNVVYTTRQNGASEILENEFIMTDPNDFSIISNIESLICNKSNLDKIKENNLKIASHFSVEKNLTESVKVMNEIIN